MSSCARWVPILLLRKTLLFTSGALLSWGERGCGPVAFIQNGTPSPSDTNLRHCFLLHVEARFPKEQSFPPLADVQPSPPQWPIIIDIGALRVQAVFLFKHAASGQWRPRIRESCSQALPVAMIPAARSRVTCYQAECRDSYEE